ncbi:MAG: ABC transporter ATP-binding protein [Treponema sp.]|jgi:iron complex transport system ATP-binding protein|nr:ABC transporter ATP-binding protein [Treponema sp.]
MSITVNQLSFSYGGRRVLERVSFQTRPGELLCVLGANGAGKSTLFHCMLGLQPVHAGEVLVQGAPVRSIKPPELARRIAYVPQSHAPVYNYTVLDMALMGTAAQINGLSSPGAAQMRTAEAALNRLGILHLRSRGYMKISGGERQLVMIARALAQEAQVLIMDEPTANLDYGNQLRLFSRVKELVKAGYTVIQSTHNPEQALLFADRILALRDGRIAALGAPEAAITAELIKSLYGVPVRLRQNAEGRLRCEPIV